MLKRKFDPNRPYRVVLYLRVSSGRQNPRSPDQQEAEIRRKIANRGLPWIVVAVYRDDAVSGRLQRRRPQYSRMLRDIKTGAVVCDLILVDSTCRFGRHSDLATVRKKLYEQQGVLVLTAESDFVDPNSLTGKAYSTLDEVRAESENTTKANSVVRGKRDQAWLKFWPGGPRPFGFRLVAVMGEERGNYVLLGHRLEPLPEEAAVVLKAFRLAFGAGSGQTKIAKALNADPELPAEFKPFFGSTVGYWLDSPLYRGELVWAANSTGIVDDVRRVEPNEVEEVVRVPDFCPPLVDTELWEAVQSMRQARRERHGPAALCRRGDAGGKEIMPLAPGLTLKYPLTGLVRCGLCEAAMRPVSGGRISCDGRRYVYYACPRGIDGQCENTPYVPEEWLRQTVAGVMLERLFPVAPAAGADESSVHQESSCDPSGKLGTRPSKNSPLAAGDVAAAEWFRELREEVLAELRREQADASPSVLEAEDGALAAKMDGWRQSLGNPRLGATLRLEFEEAFEAAAVRRAEIAAVLAAREAARRSIDSAVDAADVAARLNRLGDRLAGDNATLTNLELSLHVERIACWPDGRVVLRSCRLGALAGAVDLLSDLQACESPDGETGREGEAVPQDLGPGPSMPAGSPQPVRPRLRARLRVSGETAAEDEDLRATAEFVADPHRFAGLDGRWFEETEFRVPEKIHWYEANADAVLARVEQIEAAGERVSLNRLAPEFGVSRPTLKRALDFARARRSDGHIVPAVCSDAPDADRAA